MKNPATFVDELPPGFDLEKLSLTPEKIWSLLTSGVPLNGLVRGHNRKHENFLKLFRRGCR
jgi:hypothetical protein